MAIKSTITAPRAAYGRSAKLVCVPMMMCIVVSAGHAGHAHGEYQLNNVIARPNIAQTKPRLTETPSWSRHSARPL